MRCPKDGSEMDEVMVEGNSLNLCGKCSGVWMAWGVLSVVSSGGVTEHELIFRGDSQRLCPKCGKKMKKSNLHSVIVEECGCGLFFDKGEAKKVLGKEIEISDKTINLTMEQLAQLNNTGRTKTNGFVIKITKD